MQKNYKIDGSLGQITNKLEDKIQEGSGLSLREKSFEELVNFIPKSDYLAETINGVSLEYLIKNEPCKIFCRKLKGYDIVLHIFSNKIITRIPKINKIFVDIISENIILNTEALSICFIIDNGTLVFNSNTGIYFAQNINSLTTTENGNPIYKIFIPSTLSGDSIQKVVGDVYFIHFTQGSIKVGDYINNSINDPSDPLFSLNPQLSNRINREKGFYLHLTSGILNVGDLVTINNVSIGVSGERINLSARIIEKRRVFKFTKNNIQKIYPSSPLPKPYDEKPFNQYLTLTANNIPETAVEVDVYKIDFNYNHSKAFDDGLILPKYNAYSIRWSGLKGSAPGGYYNEIYYRENFSFVTINPTIEVAYQAVPVSTTKIYAPYTPYSLGGRLAVSYNNIIKFSKTGDYTNFNFNEKPTPTETDAFQRALQDVDEITFISKWGQLGVQEGFIIGTTKELIFFSSIANIFNTTIISRRNIPCSYIQPIDIVYQGLPASLIVEAGRTRITAVIFTRDQTSEINLTEIIDFFDTDPIKKIQAIKYGNDQMVFALTDNSNLYACLTGGSRLAWFKINLTYRIEDIASFDDGLNKKLYIISNLQNLSEVNLVGSIDFTEGVKQIKAEYFTDLNLRDDNIYSNEKPIFLIGPFRYYKLKEELTNNEKSLLPKPIIGKMTLHNQEIINKNYNTKASKTKRKISNVNVNVKNSNYFTVKYICQDNNAKSTIKTAYDVQRNDDNLNPKRVKELIQIFQGSPAMDSIKLSIETDKNSIVPLTIQSISFDTEYVNIK